MCHPRLGLQNPLASPQANATLGLVQGRGRGLRGGTFKGGGRGGRDLEVAGVTQRYLEGLAQRRKVKHPCHEAGLDNLQHMDASVHSRALYGAAVAVRKLGQVECTHVNQLAARGLVHAG